MMFVRTLPAWLPWLGSLGCGVMGGVYFAFSAFVIPALVQAGPVTGAHAMSAINRVILGSLFMPLFFGTVLVCLAASAFALWRWDGPASIAVLGASAIYLVGMLGTTIVFNVPLNNQLAGIDPTSLAGEVQWGRFVDAWAIWNHVRTLASMMASAGFAAAIVWAR